MLFLRKYVLAMGIPILVALFSVFGFSADVRAEEVVSTASLLKTHISTTTSEWSVGADMPTLRGGAYATEINSKIYVYGGASYVVSPNVHNQIYSTVEEYDPVSDTWMTKSPRPGNISGGTVAEYDDKLYVIGGRKVNPDGSPTYERVTNLDIYDPASDTWTSGENHPEGPDISTPLFTHFAIPYQDKIYALEVTHTGYIFEDLYIYDIDSDSWIEEKFLPGLYRFSSYDNYDGNQGNQFFIFDEKLHVFGMLPDQGYREVLLIFDPSTLTLETQDVVLPEIGRATQVLHEGSVHFIGGSKLEPGDPIIKNMPSHYVYNLSTNAWNSAEDLPQGLNSPATASHNGKVYVMGGAVINRFGVNYSNVFNKLYIYEETAQNIALDLTVESVQAVQAVEGQPLILDKQTAVKVVVQKTGGGADSVPVQVTYNGNTYSQFYVLNPENTANLGSSQTEVTFTESEDTKVLYFFDTALTPQSTGQYELSATIDPLNEVAEADEVNNTVTSSQAVITKDWGNLDPVLRIGLIKTDWDSSLDQEFNEYVVEFKELIQGEYPVGAGGVEVTVLGKTANSDFWRKQGSNGTKFEADNQWLGLWLRTESVLNAVRYPRIDKFVYAVPPSWFVNNTEQTRNRRGISDPGNITTVLAELVPVVAAHEIAHTYWLNVPGYPLGVCEDYEVFNHDTAQCDLVPGRIGTEVESGLWVANKRAMISTEFRPVYSFMGAIDDTVEYWITEQNYSQLITPPYSPPLSVVASAGSEDKVILAVGEVTITGTVSLDDWYVLEGGDYDSSFGSGDYSLTMLDAAGAQLYSHPFSVGMMHSSPGAPSSSFVVKLPYIEGVAEIKVIDANSAQTLATKAVTQHAPSVSFTSPTEGQVVDDSVDIEWLGEDQDSEELSYLLTYSGSGIEWQYVTPEQLRENSYTWDTSELPEGNHELSIIASDGVNSSPVASVAITVQHSQTEGQMIFLPFIAR